MSFSTDLKIRESIVIVRDIRLRTIEISRVLGKKSRSHVTNELAILKRTKEEGTNRWITNSSKC
jgi:hypothetical protein